MECKMSMDQDWSTPLEMDAEGEGDGDDDCGRIFLERPVPSIHAPKDNTAIRSRAWMRRRQPNGSLKPFLSGCRKRRSDAWHGLASRGREVGGKVRQLQRRRVADGVRPENARNPEALPSKPEIATNERKH